MNGNKYLKTVGLISLVLCIFAIEEISYGQAKDEVPLKLELEIEKEVYVSKEAIEVKVTLTNISEETLVVAEPRIENSFVEYSAEILDESGASQTWKWKLNYKEPHKEYGLRLEPRNKLSSNRNILETNLPAGDYVIRAIYDTENLKEVFPTIWHGRVQARIVNFSIVNEDAPNEKVFKEHLYKGRKYMKAKEYEKAKIEYEKAVSIDSNSSSAHAGLGYAYEGMGEMEMAVKELETALKINPRANAVGAHLLMIKKGKPLFYNVDTQEKVIEKEDQ